MKFWISSLLIVILATTLIGAAATIQNGSAAAATIPTFDIVAVVKDTSVTIKTANFPASRVFDVRMGKVGTLGVNGTLVGSTNSGQGGSLTVTYAIPADLKGQAQIAIRTDSRTGGYFSYNYFSNTTFGTAGTPEPTPTPGGPTPTQPAATRTATSAPDTTTATPASGTATPTKVVTARPTVIVPTFVIEGVVKGSKVTIKTANFPANQKFDVLMGKMGTMGVNGTLVTTQDSGTGGSFTATYDVPASLAGDRQIAIRLQSKSSGYYSYNWFWNNNHP